MAVIVAVFAAVLAAAVLSAAPATALPVVAGDPPDTGGTLFVYPAGPAPAMVEVWQNDGTFFSDMNYRTNQDGSNFHFELDDVPAGTYKLYASSGESNGARGWYKPGSMTPTIGTASSVTVSDDGTTTVTFTIIHGAAFRGRVTDSAGQPIEGLCFSLTNPADGGGMGGGQSNATGAVSMPDLVPGSYLVAYYDCSLTQTFARAQWGYPLRYWNGTKGGASTATLAKRYQIGSSTAAAVTLTANGLLRGSVVYPSDTSFEQVQAYVGKSVKNGQYATVAAPVSGRSYSLIVPAGTYTVGFYCQGQKASSTCSTGVYIWNGGGGYMAKAKPVTVAANKAVTVNEPKIPAVVAENYGHLRRKYAELVSVYCIFSRTTCHGTESLALTAPAVSKGHKPKKYKYTKTFAAKAHSTKLLSYALPAGARTALAHHKKLTATLTLKVTGQATITQTFRIA